MRLLDLACALACTYNGAVQAAVGNRYMCIAMVFFAGFYSVRVFR